MPGKRKKMEELKGKTHRVLSIFFLKKKEEPIERPLHLHHYTGKKDKTFGTPCEKSLYFLTMITIYLTAIACH